MRGAAGRRSAELRDDVAGGTTGALSGHPPAISPAGATTGQAVAPAMPWSSSAGVPCFHGVATG